MQFSRLGFALFIAVLICNISIARAQDCTCGGRAMGAPYAGGNGQPLKWVYLPHVLNSPPPPAQKLICYFKQVDNKGNEDVRDVRWEVANFFRRIVPRSKSTASCPQVAGETKPAPSNGPLYFGPSSEAYDTTVLQPKDGWGDSASNTTQETRLAGVDKGIGQLNSALTFFVDDQQGRPVAAHLNFTSLAKFNGDKAYFTYIVQNDSEVSLAVLVNLSAPSAVLERVPMLQRPLLMKPGEKRIFDASAEGQSSAEPAAIVVYDVNKNITAIDSAAFYTVPGKKEVPDESFWKRLP
jgi:hypothetical protein